MLTQYSKQQNKAKYPMEQCLTLTMDGEPTKKGSIYVYYNGAFYLTNYTRAEGAKNGAYVADDKDVVYLPGMMSRY